MRKKKAERTDGPEVLGGLRVRTLPWAPVPLDALLIDADGEVLGLLRGIVERLAMAAGLPAERAEGAALAVHELAANSLTHASDRCVVRIWTGAGSLSASVADQGTFERPAPGEPDPLAERGRGLWLVSRLCDDAEVYSGDGGTEVRISVLAEPGEVALTAG